MSTDRDKRTPAATPSEDDGAGSFKTYLEYNRVLRTWFVAFGIGGPALFLVNDDVASRLAEADELRLVALLFLIGAALQVAVALINKVSNWYVYAAAREAAATPSAIARSAAWLVEQFWIDIVADLVTIGAFGYASWLLLTVFAIDG